MKSGTSSITALASSKNVCSFMTSGWDASKPAFRTWPRKLSRRRVNADHRHAQRHAGGQRRGDDRRDDHRPAGFSAVGRVLWKISTPEKRHYRRSSPLARYFQKPTQRCPGAARAGRGGYLLSAESASLHQPVYRSTAADSGAAHPRTVAFCGSGSATGGK